jgi:hypothetical protein
LTGSRFHRYCEAVKNVTLSIEDTVYRQARAKAAAEGKSLSAIVRSALERYAAGQTWHSHVARRNRQMNTLWKKTRHFRVGQMPTREERNAR